MYCCPKVPTLFKIRPLKIESYGAPFWEIPTWTSICSMVYSPNMAGWLLGYMLVYGIGIGKQFTVTLVIILLSILWDVDQDADFAGQQNALEAKNLARDFVSETIQWFNFGGNSIPASTQEPQDGSNTKTRRCLRVYCSVTGVGIPMATAAERGSPFT